MAKLVKESYLVPQAARDRVEELNKENPDCKATVYKGHRDYVVQF